MGQRRYYFFFFFLSFVSFRSVYSKLLLRKTRKVRIPKHDNGIYLFSDATLLTFRPCFDNNRNDHGRKPIARFGNRRTSRRDRLSTDSLEIALESKSTSSREAISTGRLFAQFFRWSKIPRRFEKPCFRGPCFVGKKSKPGS